MSIMLAIVGAITIIVIAFLYLVIKSDLFIKKYCLILFQQRQKKILAEINSDPRICNILHEDESKNLEVFTETLQDYLWKKSKLLDEHISKQVFDLETVIDIAYIAWFIFFIHKNYDASKPEKIN